MAEETKEITVTISLEDFLKPLPAELVPIAKTYWPSLSKFTVEQAWAWILLTKKDWLKAYEQLVAGLNDSEQSTEFDVLLSDMASCNIDQKAQREALKTFVIGVTLAVIRILFAKFGVSL